ncbi:MAG: DUF3021 domain-containing protein [Clostridiales bacterium]|nr:DUF3021 domain-containing protein [Clostridiales bacterium]
MKKHIIKHISFGAGVKFMFSMYFMLFMAFSTLGSYFLHGTREFLIITIWQIAGAAVVFTALHTIQITKMKPMIRILIHGLLSYITVIIFSLLCGWGFAETPNVFFQFTISFLVIYAVVFIGFTLYYKSEEETLNRKLAEYKKNNQNE